MNYFIVGDVHGCYYSLIQILKKWDKKSDKLILLGDLVNKGKHTFAVLEYLIKLKKKYPEIIILKGNNEYLFENYYRDSITLSAKQKFENYNLDYIEVLNWLVNLPHFWENEKMFISHAGVAIDKDFSKIESDDISVLFNKKKLKNIGKRQFIGHVVVKKPHYDKMANAWYLDTGAGNGKKLTAAKVKQNGDVKELISIEVNRKDISRYN